MKRILTLTVFLSAFAAISTLAQQNKVVVIPLNSRNAVVTGGFTPGYAGDAILQWNTET